MKDWMNYYDVSPTGVVKSIERDYVDSRGRRRHVKSHILKTSEDRYGYEKVALSCGGKRIDSTVGRLVAEKYIPNPHDLPQVNHKNENKFDNRIDNLEWCTQIYNTRYGSRTRRSAATRSIPVICECPDGAEIHFESASQAARTLSLRQGNISACIRGEQKQTGGYSFRIDKEEAV